MTVINQSTIAKALLVAGAKFCGMAYESVPSNYKEIFEVRSLDSAFADLVMMSGFGTPQFIPEGAGMNYDTYQQSYNKIIKPAVIGMGYIVTELERLNNKAPEVVAFRAKDVGRSMAESEQRLAWNVVNNSFSAGAYVGPDGVAMMSASHPTARAGLQSNVLSVAAPLSELALEQLLIQIRKAKDDSGKFSMIRPDALVVPPDLYYEASRILKSDKQNDSANNALNVLNADGMLRKIISSPFLTDTNNYWIHTNAPDGLLHYDRYGLKFDKDTDFDTDNMRFKAKQCYVNDFMNFRAMYGSNPA